MSTREAAEILARTQGRLCVRFYRRADGKILTQDCPLGLRAIVRRVSKIASVALSAAMGFGVSATAALAQGTPALVQIQQKPAEILVEVVDPQGAVIGNARVLLKDDSAEVRAGGATNQVGALRLISPGDGLYSLEVSAPGFETHTEKLTVKSRSIIKVEMKLEVRALQGAVYYVDPTNIDTASPPPTEIAPLPISQLPA